MASVIPRTNKEGDVVSYQVKWRAGGKRTGEWQHERFDGDEAGKDAAELFKNAVDEAGQNWPPGWVKGEGYVDAAAQAGEELRYRFDNWAQQSIENRTAGKRYKRQRQRAVEMYLNPTFGNCDVRSTEHFSKATIAAWINKMKKTQVQVGGSRGSGKRKGGGKIKDMSPETLRGLHGLLSSILKEAVIAEPPLRDRNPCDLTRLPKDDDRGLGEHESTDEMEFMTPEEVTCLIDCFSRAGDKMLVRFIYGTGLRWGEVTALAAKHVRSPQAGRYEVRVTRAWKRDPGPPDVWWLGPPKTRAGRRTVEITAGLWQDLQDFGLGQLGKDDLLFPNGSGERLAHSTFYERWLSTVAEAKRRGVLPDWKYPTPHDLRHSHVAALLSDGHSLTYVQRRLGHESIKTTSDRYGHLLETAHKAALETLDRVMGYTQPASAPLPHFAPGPGAGRAVYVAQLGLYQVPFWDPDDAETTAERWVREHGGPVHVDKLSTDGWAVSYNGASDTATALQAVRTQMPRRAWVWHLGPLLHAVDGSEVVVDPGSAELRGGWWWDFESEYTEKPALRSVEWSNGPESVTEVRAWGTDEDAVRAEFAAARTEALRICGQHPQRGESGRESVT
ncbi:site-specific integrase [Streptomyces sp. NPDC096040]|uniref:tyrosine-type recombinase/integrase n=1 Tax=Streptomyces sp. NPDC096040 TaxID=3155541 RepID=UPI0033183976